MRAPPKTSMSLLASLSAKIIRSGNLCYSTSISTMIAKTAFASRWTANATRRFPKKRKSCSTMEGPLRSQESKKTNSSKVRITSDLKFNLSTKIGQSQLLSWSQCCPKESIRRMKKPFKDFYSPIQHIRISSKVGKQSSPKRSIDICACFSQSLETRVSDIDTCNQI